MAKKEVEKKDSPKFSTLVVHTAKYKTLLTKTYNERKKWEPVNEKIVKAAIPGNIGKIYVQEGDVVKAGGKLLVLEAMKMFNQLLAPIEGKIKKVHVKEGDNVPKSTVLVEFE
jgi:biotin carboxyl carrier protein